ncbi:MAG: hypothetical protein ABI855_19405, partial [Bacteroidota bacterium]
NGATPDYYTTYNQCAPSSINNPSGFQLPRTGNAYAGIFTGGDWTREYVAIKLDSTLSNGCIYYIEFYVSRANNFGMATDKMGCAFTNDTTGFYTIAANLPLIPAIQSTPGVLLTDTLNWIKISGNYIANGTEEFLLIGNFYDTTNTYEDTVSQAPYYYAYYYIDDVKVLSCDSTLAMGKNTLINKKESSSVYPNPANKYFNIFYDGKRKVEYCELYESSGYLLKRQKWKEGLRQNLFLTEEIKKRNLHT